MPKSAKLALVSALLFLALSPFSGTATADMAVTADRCSGTLVESRNIKTSDGVIGYLNVYWDGHYNCAETVSANQNWGVLKSMSAYIASCPKSNKGGDSCDVIDSDSDIDGYRYYAGPVRVDGRDRCITATGYILWPDQEGWARTSPYVGHC